MQREHLEVHDGEGRHTARALPALLRALQAGDDALAVGDRVLAPKPSATMGRSVEITGAQRALADR